MADTPKRKMSEESLKNLTPFTQNSEKSREAQKKSVLKRQENKENKIAREESKDWTWEQYGLKFLEFIDKYGDAKTKADIVKALFPNDKQTQEILGSLGIEKIFVTPDEAKETDEHINKFLNDEVTE